MIVNEIKEIMNGNVKVFNMRIEGETIGFDTPYNSNWNFMARDFEQIIDTLQQENARLKDKLIEIKKVIDGYMPNEHAMCKAFDEIEFIIKEN